MGKTYEVSSDHFHEKILAAVFFGFRTIKNPVSITVHPELMVKIREGFRGKALAPKMFDDVEVFLGLPVIEDATKEKDHISVN